MDALNQRILVNQILVATRLYATQREVRRVTAPVELTEILTLTARAVVFSCADLAHVVP
jgi:hypothetical protein